MRFPSKYTRKQVSSRDFLGGSCFMVHFGGISNPPLWPARRFYMWWLLHIMTYIKATHKWRPSNNELFQMTNKQLFMLYITLGRYTLATADELQCFSFSKTPHDATYHRENHLPSLHREFQLHKLLGNWGRFWQHTWRYFRYFYGDVTLLVRCMVLTAPNCATKQIPWVHLPFCGTFWRNQQPPKSLKKSWKI